MNKELTDQQLKFFSCLRGYIRMVGRPPTVREMGSAMGLKSPRSVSQYYQALQDAGFIKKGRGARNIQILKKSNISDLNGEGKTVPVPILGAVSCGMPLLSEENIEGQVAVSTKLARPPHQYFILKARGDSMDRAGIKNNDLVLVRQQLTAENGEKVVAVIDGETTVKEFHRKNGIIILEPRSNNPENRPIIMNQEFLVQGVVIATIPNL